MKCSYVEDLLPLYEDDLLSEETKTDIKEHLKICESCNHKHELVSKKPIPQIELTEEIEQDGVAIKKVTQRVKKKFIITIISIILATILLVMGIENAYWAINSKVYYLDIPVVNNTYDYEKIYRALQDKFGFTDDNAVVIGRDAFIWKPADYMLPIYSIKKTVNGKSQYYRFSYGITDKDDINKLKLEVIPGNKITGSYNPKAHTYKLKELLESCSRIPIKHAKSFISESYNATFEYLYSTDGWAEKNYHTKFTNEKDGEYDMTTIPSEQHYVFVVDKQKNIKEMKDPVTFNSKDYILWAEMNPASDLKSVVYYIER
ncbi:zf-HC2 domain-containing protein [Paludicola sp. MB14-C6]|uniref:zf-HC2 domain-containing protein n=1 Tax=Paludihabitans sp. MB14-C6 TaxID=3070656 RepID=UPI0027DB6FD3|nr:zf-HC2 domain-containing protein [Paludicola sp. MB14-C6]WMJ21955.1 zf-HC2 domain-containing protein [Paludicola sp. MB14-C6]